MKILKIIGKVLKYALILIIVAIIGFAIYRIFVMDNYPEQMQKYMWTDTSKECYENHPDDFHVYDVYVGQNYSKLGYFFNAYIRLTECEKDGRNEFQLTIRYNNSTIDRLAEKSTSYDKDNPFIFVLSTSEGKNYLPSKSISDKQDRYNYLRLVYEDIDMIDVDNLYINIYETGTEESKDILKFMSDNNITKIDENAFAYMPVYSSTNINKEYSLKANEIN